MKTSRFGSRSGWASNQTRRRRRTSARCCSLACAVFFECHAAPVKQTPDGALGDLQPMRPIQMPGDLDQGDVRRFLNRSQDFLGRGFNPVRAIIPALPTGPNMARLSPPIDPLDSRRRGDPEPFRRRTTRHPAFNR